MKTKIVAHGVMASPTLSVPLSHHYSAKPAHTVYPSLSPTLPMHCQRLYLSSIEHYPAHTLFVCLSLTLQ